jgi:hypothetical protein
MSLIGLMGAKGAGKDTCAAFLVQELGYTRIAFADALYREVAGAYGVSAEFLGRRDTKEQALPELALARCRDGGFVRAVLEEEHARGVTAVHDWMSRPLSPRYVLQRWGTEYRRRRGVDSYWLDRVQAAIAAHPARSYVLTDVRFANEARFVRGCGGALLRVRRPALEAQEQAERAARGTAAHPSETELLGWPVDAELVNEEGCPQALRAAVLAWLEQRAQDEALKQAA